METWEDLVLLKHPTGSNYICNPPVTDTDVDFICVVDDWGKLKKFEELGFKPDRGDDYDFQDNRFHSFRRGWLNLIVTTDLDFYRRWVEATKEAKEKNLLKKADRIALFQKHLYDDEDFFSEIPF